MREIHADIVHQPADAVWRRDLFQGREYRIHVSKGEGKKIAVLPQTMERPHLTVEELVMFGRNPYLDFGRRPSKEDRRAVREAIAAIGIGDFGKKMVDNLSGGERQKAYLAMILAQQTEMIILDEPTTYMDMENEAYFLEMIKKLKEEHKKTLLVIMHDLAQALRYGDHILVLDEQQIVFDGTSGECLESGILERVFHVKKHIFTENGEYYTMFTVQ